MKIVNIMGGLGNQMFQYAFALSLKNKFPNEEVLIDTHHFNYYPLHNGYELDRVFPSHSLKIATWKQVMRVSWYVPHYKLSRLIRKAIPVRSTEYIQKEGFAYEPEVYEKSGDAYYDGYWQGYQYYIGMENQLRGVFSFPKPNEYNNLMSTHIQSTNSVGIHVRRGDYVGNKGFGNICTEEFYQKALKHIEHSGTTQFFIFSNDISWCKEHIEPFISNATYVDGNKGNDSFWDMYLMSKCHQLIIANSSFSWWAAYLNDRVERVIAPKLWVRVNERVETQMPNWILI